MGGVASMGGHARHPCAGRRETSVGVNESVFRGTAAKERHLSLARPYDDQGTIYFDLPFLSVFNGDHLVDANGAMPQPVSPAKAQPGRVPHACAPCCAVRSCRCSRHCSSTSALAGTSACSAHRCPSSVPRLSPS